ncbi:MAG: EamA family transporter [Negativicutes bacterium]|jgi:drug/metabolite transporter (DMT)-like permease
MSSQLKGYLMALSAALFWGVGGVVAKFALNAGIHPIVLMKVRMVGAALLALPILLIFARPLLVIKKRDIIPIMLLGALGVQLTQLAYFFAMNLAGVATAAFLLYLAPVYVAMFAIVSGSERLSQVKIMVLVMSIIGGGFIAFSGGSGTIGAAGIIIGLVSGLSYAFGTVFGGRFAKIYSPYTVVFYSTAVAGICSLLTPPYTLMLDVWLTLPWWVPFYIAVLFCIIPYSLFYTSMRFLPVTNVSIVCNLEPVLAALGAFLLLGEPLRFFQAAGGVLIIMAVVLLQTTGRKILN